MWDLRVCWCHKGRRAQGQAQRGRGAAGTALGRVTHSQRSLWTWWKWCSGGKMFLLFLEKSRQLEGRIAGFCRKTSQSSEVSGAASVFPFPAEIALPSSGNGITNTNCSCCELAPSLPEGSLSQLEPLSPCRSPVCAQVSLV